METIRENPFLKKSENLQTANTKKTDTAILPYMHFCLQYSPLEHPPILPACFWPEGNDSHEPGQND